MDKLFAAIRDRHPGCEIVDVRFLVNKLQLDPNGHDVDDLDEALAGAVREAGEPTSGPAIA
ncbi:hypothetical protein [Oceanicola sp. 502str15]|uniref:hypothetical protein n=1 Tax=Oceanicola sp. 502str15 TaxID=2696061 RepID=UPI0020954374|nr:hypothetical protein [Oceanicola sp. 502str15]MCO6383760.1 hypothetical protein [Oceanicola sp. 502str15]